MPRLVALVLGICFIAPCIHAEEPISPTLINGTPVEPGTWPEIVRITTGNSGCTATIVGPRVIITAAHCGNNGATSTFTYKGQRYSARITRSGLYPGRDHDVAVGLLANDIAQANPHSIGGTATTGKEITLLGYGCIRPGGGGGNDGILRIGKSVITGFSGFDMVSRTPGGAALCYGDSGGPAFEESGGKFLLLGINSKGNIRDTNYNARLDRQESQDFLKNFAQQNGVTICGINSDCNATPPADPTCTLTANPQQLNVNQSLSLVLQAQNATSADIDGTQVNVPSGEKRLTPQTAGTFTATGTVRNAAGKSATCQASYTVNNNTPPPTRPSCTLTAVPKTAAPGESITLELQASGQVDYGSIDGTQVSVPVGKILVTRQAVGDYSANGFVRGAGGSANCFTDYSVAGNEPPPTPEFAIAPTHCGSNRLPESGVGSACIAVVKRDASWKEFFLERVLIAKYTDGSLEMLPILASKTMPRSPGSQQTTEELTVYANQLTRGGTYLLLDTRKASVKSMQSTGVPLELEGRSAKGRYFLIEKLDAFNVNQHLSMAAPVSSRPTAALPIRWVKSLLHATNHTR